MYLKNEIKMLEQLFRKNTQSEIEEKEIIIGSGSNRKYYRLKNQNISLIGVEGNSLEENNAFISLTQHFTEKHLPVPQLLAISEDKKYYLLEDLGNLSLFDFIKDGREKGSFNEQEKNLLHKTISKLPLFQMKGAENLDFSVCYPQSTFNSRSVHWDLNYFKYYFLKTTNIDFQEDKLEDDFERFEKILLKNNNNYFLYRDFQSRNVMIKDDEPYFIDYQGGRKGGLHYDVASFLYQAKANFNDNLREELLNTYLNELQKLIKIDTEQFKKELNYYVLFRTLQVLGAYGFRGYFEKKTHFIESVPFAINNLKQLLEKYSFSELNYLPQLLEKMCTQTIKKTEKKSNLTITIYSFSYKKGIPKDYSDNGGGFVFDCRAIHNPGRYAQYKQLTGMDKPVIDFLEADGEITPFLTTVYDLVDKTITRYIERNFSNLMVNFGCTGGQHRSVYSAEKTAQHIHEKFNIKVNLIHREQKIEKRL